MASNHVQCPGGSLEEDRCRAAVAAPPRSPHPLRSLDAARWGRVSLAGRLGLIVLAGAFVFVAPVGPGAAAAAGEEEAGEQPGDRTAKEDREAEWDDWDEELDTLPMGYPDPFAFSKQFKREVGVPPSTYSRR